MLRNLIIQRCHWKTPIALPPQLADRRAAFVARATGPQLKRICQKPKPSDRDAALLDVWRRLAPRHAVARRVLDDCGVVPRHALIVGAGAATVAALPPGTKCTVVEVDGEREAAAKALLGDTTVEWHADLTALATEDPSPERAFDFVIATDHLAKLDEELLETHLAVLWGCVKKGGLLALVERDVQPVAQARARLLGADEAQMVEPSTPLLLPQVFAEPQGGPPPRSLRKADAGTALKPRAQRVEKFASCVLRRGSQPASGRRRKAVVTATPLKRAGHVILDCRDDAGNERRLTLSRAKMYGAAFKDARRLTVGSVLTWDGDPD